MTFAENFIRSRGKAIEVAGRQIVPMFRKEVSAHQRVRVIWCKSVNKPVQGIRMKLHGGALKVDEKELKDVVLWRDTSPDDLVITCQANHPTELRVWNCWRDDRGVMQAWVGNAGMQIACAVNGRVTVKCNSRSEVTFEDLIFDLVFESHDS